MSESGESWLTLELQDRRYITIVEGDAVAAPPDKPPIWDRLEIDPKLRRWAPLAVPLLAMPLLPIALPIGAAFALDWIDKNFPGWQADVPPGGGQINVLPVPRRLVGDADFGPQGWEAGIVYAANPRKPRMYRALAIFQEEMLLHKITELERLINGLGAREYEIRHSSGKVSEAGGSVGVAGLGGIGAGGQRSRLTERRWAGTSDGHDPVVPSGMVWFESEPDWQNLAESRLSRARRQFSFSVRQSHDFGVDAKLAASVMQVGLEIGGNFRSVEQVEFTVCGSF
jgi:hypothetical protein